MQTYRSSILPIVAIALAIFGISYSLTHNNEAVAKTPSGSSVLVQEVARFEKDLAELNLVHENHIRSYSDEMGCVKDSKALEIVSHHKSLLEHNKQRLEYHKLQLVQADTSNAERNQGELAEDDARQVGGAEARDEHRVDDAEVTLDLLNAKLHRGR